METVTSHHIKENHMMLSIPDDPEPQIIGELLDEECEGTGEEYLLRGTFVMMSGFTHMAGDDEDLSRAWLEAEDGRLYDARNLRPRITS